MLFELADSVYELSGAPRAWEEGVPEKFEAYKIKSSPPGSPVNSLEISIEAREHLVPVGAVIDFSELTEFFPNEQGVRYVSPWCEGFIRYKEEILEFDLTCHPKGIDWSGNIIENALRVMVAYSVLNRGGFMLHSASVIVRDEAFVLVGHSGAGKSTCSQFAVDAGHYVISDDINVLLPVEDKAWQVVTVPFNGSADVPPIRLPSSQKVRLKSVYGLCQSGITGSKPVSAATAVAKLYASMPFINADTYRSDKVLERLTDFVNVIPFRQLDFRRSPEFLAELEKAS